jgi:cytochrome b561
VTLIAIHVLAAVRHLVLRDGIFSRMGWTRAGSRHSLFIPTSSNRP